MNLKRTVQSLLLLGLAMCVSTARAEDGKKDYVSTLRIETRFDYDFQAYDEGPSTGGFSGRYLNFFIEGNISDKFSYSYRQRILPNSGNKSFFDGTDWFWLQYRINNNFSIMAGKQVLAIGGWEFDAAPIDVYYWSGFGSNVNTGYQFGLSSAYTTDNGRHKLTLQVANTCYTKSAFSNMYGYSLMWNGNMGAYQTIWSVNLMEYTKGRFINYISLGNKVTFGRFSAYLDLMNRAVSRQPNFFFDDITVIGKAQYGVAEKWNVFAKGGYDRNKAQDAALAATPELCYDPFVLPGTKYYYYGVGAEFFPLKNSRDIRVHAFFAMKNGGFNEYHCNVGLTWRIDIKKCITKLFKK